MITVAICDDEMKFRRNILQCCHQYFGERQMEFRITEYDSGEAFLMGDHPDILLLDITIRKISGVIIKEVLARGHAETRIIFFAESKNFVTEAFGKNVFGYLIKPIRYPMFCKKMDEVVEDILEREQYVYCKVEKEIERVYLERILYLESFNRYTKVHVQGAKEYRVSDKGLCKWLEFLPEEQYVRCNRMQIVNLRYVARVKDNVELINGMQIELSRRWRDDIIVRYERWNHV